MPIDVNSLSPALRSIVVKNGQVDMKKLEEVAKTYVYSGALVDEARKLLQQELTGDKAWGNVMDTFVKEVTPPPEKPDDVMKVEEYTNRSGDKVKKTSYGRNCYEYEETYPNGTVKYSYSRNLEGRGYGYTLYSEEGKVLYSYAGYEDSQSFDGIDEYDKYDEKGRPLNIGGLYSDNFTYDDVNKTVTVLREGYGETIEIVYEQDENGFASDKIISKYFVGEDGTRTNLLDKGADDGLYALEERLEIKEWQ